MRIKDEEINLRITPQGIYEVEKINPDIDILGILRMPTYDKKEPRLSDYLKLIYVAYVTVKYVDNKEKIDISLDDFINFFDMGDTDTLVEINKEGVKLLFTPKN